MAVTTTNMTYRVGRYAVALVRLRLANRALRSAQIALGNEILSRGCGDKATLASLQELQKQIDNTPSRPPRSLVAAREALLIQLVEALDSTADVNATPKGSKVLGARQECEDFDEMVRTARADLMPSASNEIRRIAAGYGTVLVATITIVLLIAATLRTGQDNLRGMAGTEDPDFAVKSALGPAKSQATAPSTPAQEAAVSKGADLPSSYFPPSYYEKSELALLRAAKTSESVLMDGRRRFSCKGAMLLLEIARTAAIIGDFKTIGEVEELFRKASATDKIAAAFYEEDVATARAVVHASSGNADEALEWLHRIGVYPPQRLRDGYGGSTRALVENGNIDGAERLLKAYADLVETTQVPDEPVESLATLGETQAFLGLLGPLSATRDRIFQLWHDRKGENSGIVAGASAQLAVALADAGYLGEAKVEANVLRDLFPKSLARSTACFGIAEAYARALSFRDAILTASDIDNDFLRCRCLILVHSQQIALHPLYQDAASRLSALIKRHVSDLRLEAVFGDLECESVSNDAKVGLTDAAEKYIHSSATPARRARVALALAETAAQRDNRSVAESYLAETLELAQMEQDANEQQSVLIDLGRVAFRCGGHNLLERRVTDREAYIRGCVLLGIAKGIITEDSIEVAANRGLVYKGTIERPRGGWELKNETWKEFLARVIAEKTDFLPSEDRLYVKTPERHALAVPAVGGFDLVYPPTFAGVLGLTELINCGYFDATEREALGQLNEGHTNKAIDAGRFRVEKRFLARPEGWLALTLRRQEVRADRKNTAPTKGKVTRDDTAKQPDSEIQQATMRTGPRTTGMADDNVAVVVSRSSGFNLPTDTKFLADGHEYVTTQLFSAVNMPELVRNKYDRLVKEQPDGNYVFTVELRPVDGRAGSMLEKDAPLVLDSPRRGFVRAYALRRIGDDATSPVAKVDKAMLQQLQTKLNDSAPSARVNAAKALGRLRSGASPAIPALCDLLKDENDSVRRAAAEALGAIGPEARAAVGPLTETIKDTRMWFREEAVCALGSIGPDAEPAIPALLDVYVDACHSHERLSDAVVVSLGRIGKAIVNPMVNCLRSPTSKSEARKCALRALGELGPGAVGAVPAILDRVREREGTPDFAKLMLAKICRSRLSVLVDATKDPDATVRSCVIGAMGEIGPQAQPACDVVIAALKDPAYRVRINAVHALVRMKVGSTTAVPPLIELLCEERLAKGLERREYNSGMVPSDPSEVYREAVKALGGYGTGASQAIEPLIEELRDGWDERSQNEAAEALAKIGKAAVPKLIETLNGLGQERKTDETQSRFASRKSSAKLSATRSLWRMGSDAQDAVLPLLALLDDSDDIIDRNRNSVFHALEAIGKAPREAYPAIMQRLRSPDSRKRLLAITLLAGVEEEDVLAEIAEALSDSDTKVRAAVVARLSGANLVGKSKAMVPKLVKALSTKDASVRMFSARALGDIGAAAESAIEPLEAVAKDSNPRVSECARIAIREINASLTESQSPAK